MQVFTKFTALTSIILTLSVLATQVVPSPAPVQNIVTEEEFFNWLDTTDANLTFIGAPIVRSLDRRFTSQAGAVMVTYCTKRTQNVCGGSCSVYNGGPACLDASGTNCLSATANVGFCDRAGCGGSCNQFSSCGTRLANNFCFTPGTKSIIVPPA